MMNPNDKKCKKLEYERFIDLMAQLYLKYGAMYEKVTSQMIIEKFTGYITGTRNGKCRMNKP